MKLRHGLNKTGKKLRYYLNFSRVKQSFVYPHSSGTDLLTGRAIKSSERVTLDAWDLVIVEER
ncbi:Beta-galactosidase C-terminal domain [Acidobacteria bacterium AH-259-G07]|nr:Beta-galactosidase C-terminal domain [Acidobacteria bacterium AH-259-G07]